MSVERIDEERERNRLRCAKYRAKKKAGNEKAKEVKERLERKEAEPEKMRRKQPRSEPRQQKLTASLRPADGKRGPAKTRAETRGGGYHPSCSGAPFGSSGSSSIKGSLFPEGNTAMENNSSIECSKAGVSEVGCKKTDVAGSDELHGS